MKRLRSQWWFVVVLSTVFLYDSPIMAQRTMNRGLHAVPAPKKVVIDGDLGEWDSSGAIVCCKDVRTMLDTESARVAAMWDKDNLYVGIEYRDPAPMLNRIDPITMPGNGWRSDCVQLRLNMNGFVTHLDAWYYTPAKKSAMTIKYGRLGDKNSPKVDRPRYPEKLGARQAFRLAKDGKGYVQEMKIPWAVITLDGKMPAKGADLRMGLEMFWGDISARAPRSRVTDNIFEGHTTTDFFWTNVPAWGRLILEDKNNLQLPVPPWLRARGAAPQGPVPITFTMPADGYVTIAVEDGRGNRVKSLLGGAKFAKGAHTVRWSGLDDRNQPLPAGAYRWVGIRRDAINVRWLMSFYQPNRKLPWRNQKGTGAWGVDHGSLQAAAAGDGLIFLAGLGAEAGYPLLAINEAGEKVWSVKSGEPDYLAYADGILYAYTSRGGSNWLRLAQRGIQHFNARTGEWLDVPAVDGPPLKRRPLLKPKEQSSGFAADTGGVYIAIKGQAAIKKFHRRTFRLMKQYSVPADGQIFAAGDGKLLVASAKGLLELNLKTGKTVTLLAGDLGAARRIAADGKGSIYVSFGAPSHQVKVYKRSGDGAALSGAIGKAGGRTQNGWYDPKEGFHNPTGLATDSKGQLWVVEMGYRPKRTSVWKGGKWQREFIGDTGYGGGGIINPIDPTEALYNSMQFKIDLDGGTWKLVQVGMVLPTNAADYSIDEAGMSSATGRHNPTEYMTACGGRAYVTACRGAIQIYRKRPDKRWVLCVYINPRNKFAWIDRNDDGVIQDGEVVRGAKKDNWGRLDYWGNRPSQNMDLYFAGIGRDSARGLRLRPQGFSKAGTPLYDLAKFEPMAGECQNGIGLRDGGYNSGCRGERGEYHSEMRKTYPAAGAGKGRRTFWFRGLNTGRWTYRLPEPGVVIYPFQAHGVADVPSIKGEVVCWVSDYGQRYLFTDDMLYVDQLFADARANWVNWPAKPKRGFVADRMPPGQESFHGYFTGLKDGRYVLTTGFTDCRVFEVAGLASLRRFKGGKLTLKKADLARARQIRAYLAAETGGAVSATVARAAKPLPTDGKLAKYKAEPLRIAVDDQRGADVRCAYDDKNLYVAWDVRDANPMINRAGRLELAFKGGDAVDLMFRAPGGKLDAPGVRAGDLRLLITEIAGKARAVIYRPVSKVKRPYVFDAYEGAGRANAVKMDEVRIADEVRPVIRKRKGGYVVEAAVPWKLLGGAPKPGAEGRIDFGVLFGDPSGMTTVLRAYWSNRDTNIVTDIPSEARLQPGNWGICRFGK